MQRQGRRRAAQRSAGGLGALRAGELWTALRMMGTPPLPPGKPRKLQEASNQTPLYLPRQGNIGR